MGGNQTLLLGAWAALAGGLIPVLAALSGGLNRSLQSPMHVAAISMAVGAVVGGLALLVFRPAAPSIETLRATPWHLYVGGTITLFYALTAAAVAPRIGVGNLVICVVVAQLVVSSVIDQFGLLGAPVHPVDLKRAAGLVLLGAGAALVALR
jgi:bacterial/archaeal transporter family-2 protein